MSRPWTDAERALARESLDAGDSYAEIAAWSGRTLMDVEGLFGPERYRKRAVLRRLLHRVQGGVCAVCGEPMRGPLPHLADWYGCTIDRVVCGFLGGEYRLGNVVGVHRRCNARKGHRPPNGCDLVWMLAVNARLDVHPKALGGLT